MAKWAQWFINNNLRWLLYVVAVVYLPFAIVFYIATTVMPDIWHDIKREFKEIARAKKR